MSRSTFKKMVLRPLDTIENKRSLTDSIGGGGGGGVGVKRQKTKKLNVKQKSTTTTTTATKIDQFRRYKQWKSLGR